MAQVARDKFRVVVREDHNSIARAYSLTRQEARSVANRPKEFIVGDPPIPLHQVVAARPSLGSNKKLGKVVRRGSYIRPGCPA